MRQVADVGRAAATARTSVASTRASHARCWSWPSLVLSLALASGDPLTRRRPHGRIAANSLTRWATTCRRAGGLRDFYAHLPPRSQESYFDRRIRWLQVRSARTACRPNRICPCRGIACALCVCRELAGGAAAATAAPTASEAEQPAAGAHSSHSVPSGSNPPHAVALHALPDRVPSRLAGAVRPLRRSTAGRTRSKRSLSNRRSSARRDRNDERACASSHTSSAFEPCQSEHMRAIGAQKRIALFASRCMQNRRNLRASEMNVR